MSAPRFLPGVALVFLISSGDSSLLFPVPEVYTGYNGVAAQSSSEGLYFATPREIFVVKAPINGGEMAKSVFKAESYARITGLAYDSARSLIFWSDISINGRGIYQGTLTPEFVITNNKTLVDSDIEEVNCISVDWVHGNLYWTDARKRTIEVISYIVTDKSIDTRRVLFSDSLINPRGIYADPISGYLFWNDQGKRSIERSQLDGSGVRQVVAANQTYPNQMAVYSNKLYWVNSDKKSIWKSELDGSQAAVISSFPYSPQHIFGLAISQQDIYVTNWGGTLFKVSQTASTNSMELHPLEDYLNGKTIQIFSAAYYSSALQPQGNNLCTNLKCSHLCMGVDAATVRCSCPSFGAKILPKGGTNCQPVSGGNVLLYALGGSGYVGFTPIGVETQERYFIGRSIRPVGVAYDPTSQEVYWSDVTQRTIYRIRFDGTGLSVILSDLNGLGIVDGMVLDYNHGKLYYSHYGYIYIDGTPFSWHKIEVLDLGQNNSTLIIRTIVTDDQKPRAVVLDLDQGFLYYTDWSDRARIMRTNLDGSNPFELRAGLDNPNGLALVGSGSNKKLFYVDSHEKTRHANQQYPNAGKNGAIYSMNVDGTGFKAESPADSRSYGLGTPYGCSWNAGGGLLYVSDWDKSSVVAINPSTGFSGVEILSGVESPMMVHFTPYSASSNVWPSQSKWVEMGIKISSVLTPGSCASSNGGCSDTCFTSPVSTASSAVCACNTYATSTTGNTVQACEAPNGFAVVADMNSVKMYGLDGRDIAVYSPVQAQPYFSNLVATVYDPVTKYVYYSDVHGKWIMRVGFGGNATQFFRINNVIEGMTIVHSPGGTSKLYWTDSTYGQIAYIDLPSDGSTPDNYTVLVTDLLRPRAIKLSQGYLYWTEWGEGSGKVSRLSLNSGGPKYKSSDASIIRNNLNWVNGLFIDEANSRLYISDGHKDSKNVFNCSLDGSGCTPVPGIGEKAKHIFDIWLHKGIVYYTDWKSNAVMAYSPQYSMSWPILKNLMRPSQLYLNLPPDAATKDYCQNGNGGCQDVCISLLGSSKCACTGGKVLSIVDGKNCVDPGTKRCDYTPQSLSIYNYQGDFTPQVCTHCQCLAGDVSTSFYGDWYYNSSRCDRVGYCPSPACGGDGSTVPDANNCCPVCVTPCDVQITNCPSVPVILRMSAESPSVWDYYIPSVRDCQGTQRIITLTRDPPPDKVYRYSKDLLTATWTATINGGKIPATCTYQLQIIDEIPPQLDCPAETVVIYTNTDSAELRYRVAPSDNTEIIPSGFPKCKPEFGTVAAVGTHQITCNTADLANNTNSCQFNVSIVKNNVLTCKTLYINHGDLDCNLVSGIFQCDINCNGDGVYNYYNTQPFPFVRCVDGKWKGGAGDTIDINADVFTVTTCKKRIKKPLSGNVTVIGRNACKSSVDLGFTVDFIQKTLTDDYLWRSYFPLVSNVFVDGCGNKRARTKARQKRDLAVVGDNDIMARIVISGMYTYSSDRLTVKQDIDSILQLIGSQFNKGFFRLVYSGDWKDRTWYTPAPPDMEITPAVDGCLEGTVEAEDGCDVCPAGMYAPNTTKCIPCNKGYYNQWEAQYECSFCETGQTPGLGSYTFRQCVSSSSDTCPTACIIGLAVGFGGLIILVLVLVIIALAIRLRRSKKSEKNLKNNLDRKENYDHLQRDPYEDINDDPAAQDKYYNEIVDQE